MLKSIWVGLIYVALFISITGLSFECLAAPTVKLKEPLQLRTIAISPYGIKSDAHMGGIYFDLAETLLDQLNLPYDHDIYPYARIMHELKIGTTDLTILFKYDELVPYVTYIHPLPSLKNVVMGKKGTEFLSIQALEGKTIAYLRGAKFSDAIDHNDKITKLVVIDFEQGLKLLARYRVDAIIGPLEPIYSAAKRLGYTRAYFGMPLIVSQRTPWLQMSKKSKNKVPVAHLKATLSELIESGKLKQIQMQYRK